MGTLCSKSLKLLNIDDGKQTFGEISTSFRDPKSMISVTSKSNRHSSTDKTLRGATEGSFHLQIGSNEELVLSANVLKAMNTFIDVVCNNMLLICKELSKKNELLPEYVIEILKLDDETIANDESIVKANINDFVVTFAYSQNLLIYLLKQDFKDTALEFLEQMTVRYSLKQITPEVYQIFTSNIIQILLENKLMTAKMNDVLIIYFNFIAEYMVLVFNSQRSTALGRRSVKDKNRNCRGNKARENYRLMKLWKYHDSLIASYKKQFELLFAKRDGDEDILTLDTIYLKETDCFLNWFSKRKKKSKQNDQSKKSGKSSSLKL